MIYVATLLWCVIAIYMNTKSLIARSYANWFWVVDERFNYKRSTVWINLITPTLSTMILTPVIFMQYFICWLATIFWRPPRNTKWTFYRFSFLAYQLVWYKGHREPKYFYPNGDLI